jgi:hypothetical protein
MYQNELQKLEGVWTGTERIDGEEGCHDAQGRWEFHTVFDGRFLLCDYVQTARDRPTSVGHGVFRKDDGVAEGEMLVFMEATANASTRTTYSVVLNRLSVITERSVRGGEWKAVFEGTYRRPRG